ncbi:MAG: putative tRNA threonylcarbamoyladenosine biosynthesis protein Gcp, partial [Candidatus Woesebacteria bacterium GW2011_GWF2_46_8]
KWGGVVPSLAKRAHEEKIDYVVNECLRKYRDPIETIDYFAVTQGPGLAIALEVGIKKIKQLSLQYNKQLIPVNHLEGHLYSSFVQNSKGNPKQSFMFPYLGIIISGGHTEIVRIKDHVSYETLGETIDDAAGEAIDKAAKMLGLGYPGGPVVERLAREVKNREIYHFPRPMIKNQSLNFSFSGLKTSLYYFLKEMNENKKLSQLKDIASSYQEAIFDTLITKTEKAMKETGISRLIVGGGVIANMRLRRLFRGLVNTYEGEVLFPPYSYLTGDNAAMIGVAAYYKAKKNIFVKNLTQLDRIPRFPLPKYYL